jgi:hypothetical protein
VVDGLTAYVPPDGGDPGWKVQFHVGLLQYAPMGEAQRAVIQREEERERKAAELEEQQRHERAIELRWELQQRGVTPMSHEQILAAASAAGDRDDRREARLEREAAEQMGRPEPRLDKYQMKREQAEAAAAAEVTPATKAEVSKLSQAVTQLKGKLHAQGRRSAEQERRRESPEDYARAYGDGGVRYRSGGSVVRGPY